MQMSSEENSIKGSDRLKKRKKQVKAGKRDKVTVPTATVTITASNNPYRTRSKKR